MQSTQEQLITTKELAEILQVRERTVYLMIENKEIPFYQLGEGGTYRFNKESVLQALSKNQSS